MYSRVLLRKGANDRVSQKTKARMRGFKRFFSYFPTETVGIWDVEVGLVAELPQVTSWAVEPTSAKGINPPLVNGLGWKDML